VGWVGTAARTVGFSTQHRGHIEHARCHWHFRLLHQNVSAVVSDCQNAEWAGCSLIGHEFTKSCRWKPTFWRHVALPLAKGDPENNTRSCPWRGNMNTHTRLKASMGTQHIYPEEASRIFLRKCVICPQFYKVSKHKGHILCPLFLSIHHHHHHHVHEGLGVFPVP
jgi:hypothetical protein